MKAWRKLLVSEIILAAVGAAGLVEAAGPYDGSRSILCVVTAIVECNASGPCERQVPDGVNSPAFLRVDVAAQAISDGVGKKSQLKSVSHVDGELILQGGENGRGWSTTIDEASGRMAAAVVDNDHTFSLFGTCTIP